MDFVLECWWQLKRLFACLGEKQLRGGEPIPPEGLGVSLLGFDPQRLNIGLPGENSRSDD